MLISGPLARPAPAARPRFPSLPPDFGDSFWRRALGAKTRGGRRRWVVARGPSFYGGGGGTTGAFSPQNIAPHHAAEHLNSPHTLHSGCRRPTTWRFPSTSRTRAPP